MLKIVLLAALRAAPMVQNCMNTNRLCVENPDLKEQKEFTLFFPANQFPMEVDMSNLVLNVYSVKDMSGLGFDPCNVPGTLVSSSAVKTEPTDSSSVSSTQAIIKFNAEIATGSKFIMQLADPAKRQCILGPNIGNQFTDSIIIEKAPTDTTSTARPTSTITEPDSELPIEGGSNSDTITKVVVAAIIIIAALVIIGTIFLCRRKFKKEPTKQEPPKPQEPKKTNPPVTQLNLF